MLGEDLYAERNQTSQDLGSLVYEPIPEAFRNQVERLWSETIGYPSQFEQEVPALLVRDPKFQWWKQIHDTMTYHMGVKQLAPTRPSLRGSHSSCVWFLTNSSKTEWVLTLIELTFRLINNEVRAAWDRTSNRSTQRTSISPDTAIEELNGRFQSNRLGYRFGNGQIIKISSEFLYGEVTKPALALINDPKFATANIEFINAHGLQMSGQYEQAIVEATKALESSLKTICNLRNWPYDHRDTLTKLVETVISQGLIDKSLTSNYTSLANLLKQVAAVRNRAAHGQGTEPNAIPERMANYVLHSVANEITFLVTSCQEFEQS